MSQNASEIRELKGSLNRKENELLLQQQKVAKLEASLKTLKGKGGGAVNSGKSGGLLDFTAEQEINFL